MNESIKGELLAYCYMIQTGCKPVANMPLQDRYIEDVMKMVRQFNLKMYIEELSEGWKSIYIYDHDYMLEVIKSSPSHPRTPYEHWILGKMFGYSDEAIGEFVNK